MESPTMPQEGATTEAAALEAAPTQAPQEEAQRPQDVEALQRELERLQAELRRVREEAARRRVEKKTVEERLQELEQIVTAQRERAIRAEARAALVAELGDPAVADAALVLAREAGFLEVQDDRVQVHTDKLLERFPFLRPQRPAPRDSGAAPSPAPSLRFEDIANLSVEEYAARRQEILQRLRGK